MAGSVGQPLALTGTPLVASRSLGLLLRFGSLAFKLESAQPTGSWLDRGAARVVREPAQGRSSLLGVVGVGSLTDALAAQCARVGRQLVVLAPAEPVGECGWLDAFGARLLMIDADEVTIQSAAPELLSQIGGRYVDRSNPAWQAGLRELQQEISTEARPDALLAISSVTGGEAGWLVEATREGQPAVTLPLDGLDRADDRLVAVVAMPEAPAGHPDCRSGVVQQPVSAREAIAAQRLLAREEGIITSRWGAAGLAALIRVVQEDRRAPLRARRLPRELSAVVVVTRELSDAGGPPLAPDTLPRHAVSMAEAHAGLARSLAASGDGN